MNITATEILALPMQLNDAGATTIKSYLRALLHELWTQEEGFSGKRPFGNSGWTHDLMVPLVKAKVIEGKLDTDGYLGDYDREAGDHAIHDAIAAL